MPEGPSSGPMRNKAEFARERLTPDLATGDCGDPIPPQVDASLDQTGMIGLASSSSSLGDGPVMDSPPRV